jgi:hypothetical protein
LGVGKFGESVLKGRQQQLAPAIRQCIDGGLRQEDEFARYSRTRRDGNLLNQLARPAGKPLRRSMVAVGLVRTTRIWYLAPVHRD